MLTLWREGTFNLPISPSPLPLCISLLCFVHLDPQLGKWLSKQVPRFEQGSLNLCFLGEFFFSGVSEKRQIS